MFSGLAGKLMRPERTTPATTLRSPCEAPSCAGAVPAGRAAAPGPSEASPSGSAAGGGAPSPAGGTWTRWRGGSCLRGSGERLNEDEEEEEEEVTPPLETTVAPRWLHGSAPT